MKNQIIIIFFLTLFCISCNNADYKNKFNPKQINKLQIDSSSMKKENTRNIINIDLSEYFNKDSILNFHEVIDSVKFIILDNDIVESLVGNISKILITKEYIYIMDNISQNGVVIFDINGKFVKRIPIGTGPGEIYRLYDISFDYDDNNLILNQAGKIYFYSSEGEYIKNEEVPFAFQEIIGFNNQYVIHQQHSVINQHLHVHEQNSIIVTDKNFKINFSGLPIVSKIPFFSIDHNLLFYNNKKEYIILKNFCDTIFSLKNDELIAKYVFNLGKKEFPYSKVTNIKYENFEEFNKEFFSDDYIYINKYLETSEFQYIFICGKNNPNLKIYIDKTTGHIIGGIGTIIENNDIPNISDPMFFTDNEWFFVPIYWNCKNFRYSNKYISEEDNQKISSLDEESNPVIFLFKLKHF